MRTFLKFRKPRSRAQDHRRKTLRLWQVWPLWLLFGPLLVLAAGAFISLIRSDRPHSNDIPEIQLAEGQDLRLALGNLGKHQLRLYSYLNPKGTKTRFAVQRMNDDAVETTLMSCGLCYRAERPHYSLKGRVMCGRCNHAMHVPSEKGLTAVQKQCTLIAIPHSVTKDELLVRAGEVLNVARSMDTR